MTLTELLRNDPPVLERITVQLTRDQLRKGIDLAALTAAKPHGVDIIETTLVSPQLVCHQIWRGIRLDVDPLRSSEVSLLSDSFRLEVSSRLLIDESMHLASNAWRAAKFRYFPELLYVRIGDRVSAFVKDPAAEAAKTRVQLEIYGWELTDEFAKIIEAEVMS